MKRSRQPDDTVAIRYGDRYRLHTNLRMRRSLLLITHRLIADTPGITHLALGNGVGNGTLALPQEPNTERSTIRGEFNRVAITSIDFDDLTNLEGDTFSDGARSNRLLVETLVPLEAASDLITEVALFGGAGADQADGGTIFAWSTFPVIDNREGGTDPEAPKDLSFDWVLKFPLINPEECA